MLQKVLVTATQSISCIQQINTISTRCDDDDQTTPELQRISSAAAWHGRAIITRRNQSWVTSARRGRAINTRRNQSRVTKCVRYQLLNYDCKRFAIANERTNLTCERSTQRALRAFHNLQTSLVIYIEQRVRVPPLTCDIDGAATTVMSVCRSVTYCVEMSVIWLLDDFCPSSPDIP